MQKHYKSGLSNTFEKQSDFMRYLFHIWAWKT